jgi:hypothetical protein
LQYFHREKETKENHHRRLGALFFEKKKQTEVKIGFKKQKGTALKSSFHLL